MRVLWQEMSVMLGLSFIVNSKNRLRMLLLTRLHHVHVILTGADLVSILFHALKEQPGIFLALWGHGPLLGKGWRCSNAIVDGLRPCCRAIAS